MTTLFAILGVLAAFLWLWALYDIFRANRRNNRSPWWLLLVVVIPVLGPLIYFRIKGTQRL